ncbi:hypothetical protein ES706_01814 [subsurface metagenome]
MNTYFRVIIMEMNDRYYKKAENEEYAIQKLGPMQTNRGNSTCRCQNYGKIIDLDLINSHIN